MTLHIPTWTPMLLILVALFITPILYDLFRGSQGDWDMRIDSALILIGCWSAGLAFGLAWFITRL